MKLILLREYWRKLIGNVHPEDELVFRSEHHTFNLDYPPPAFIGDVDQAPILILKSNGGYDSIRTRTEFSLNDGRAQYLDWLHGSRREPPDLLPDYYTHDPLFPLVRKGLVAFVNAVAYRSPKLTNEPENKRTAELLPSVKMHRKWLREQVLPVAKKGDRFVVLHRWAMWKITPLELEDTNYITFSPNPVSEHLTHGIRQKIVGREQSEFHI